MTPDAEPGGGGEPERLAVAFTRLVRGRGLPVGSDAAVQLAAAWVVVGLHSREYVYWATNAVLLRRPEDREAFDTCFRMFFDRAPAPASEAETRSEVVVGFDRADDDAEPDHSGNDDEGAVEVPARAVRYSAREAYRHKDFAEYTHEEFAEAHLAMQRLRLLGARRRTRRRVPSGPRRGDLDLRRTVAAALRTGGEAINRPRRRRTERPRRVVLLCDVSGSMEPYARALLRFLHVAVVGRGDVEAFALGTRLTRVTHALRHRDPDTALARAAARVVDYSGGTRLGASLKTFNDEWGIRGLARGAVVVILSDGWDRGEPELLGEQVARLQRVAHRVVWVNPLKATPGYEPRAQGMAAALPAVDAFVPGNSLVALDELVRVVAAP